MGPRTPARSRSRDRQKPNHPGVKGSVPCTASQPTVTWGPRVDRRRRPRAARRRGQASRGWTSCRGAGAWTDTRASCRGTLREAGSTVNNNASREPQNTANATATPRRERRRPRRRRASRPPGPPSAEAPFTAREAPPDRQPSCGRGTPTSVAGDLLHLKVKMSTAGTCLFPEGFLKT